jgi:hypothetical protein
MSPGERTMPLVRRTSSCMRCASVAGCTSSGIVIFNSRIVGNMLSTAAATTSKGKSAPPAQSTHPFAKQVLADLQSKTPDAIPTLTASAPRSNRASALSTPWQGRMLEQEATSGRFGDQTPEKRSVLRDEDAPPAFGQHGSDRDST